MAREYVAFASEQARDRFCAAVDKALNLPDDVPGPPNGPATAHIETWPAVYDDPGPPARYIARIDDDAVASVIGQTVTIKNAGNQDVQVTISLAGTTRGVPNNIDAWEKRLPRGGLPAPASLAAKAKGRGR